MHCDTAVGGGVLQAGYGTQQTINGDFWGAAGNKAGGILYGRDVTLTATRGDVINERTVTRAVGAEGY
ncbi:hypothetical protein K5D53_23945, partial [Pseudomonas cichorii]|nr:hypothetical protein [Pseudomonas cichorii]